MLGIHPILPYVYKLVHKETGEFYIGYRWKNKVCVDEDFGTIYKTSSKYVKPKFAEFESSIIAEFYDSEDAYWFEQSLIEENFADPLILNKKYQKKRDGKFRFGYSEGTNSSDARKKISEAMMGRKQSAEHVEKNRIRQVGVKKTEEQRNKLRVPKTITPALLAAHERQKTLTQNKCSCLWCKKEFTVSSFGMHRKIQCDK